MNVFQISDIFEFAIRIEEDGERFYREASKTMENRDARALFNFLADEEINHRRVFQDMLQALSQSKPAESYEGEYLSYLKEYIDDKVVFTREERAMDVPKVQDMVSAINFALGRELNSIAFYEEIKRLVTENRHGLINKIISEEREHFARLGRLKKDLPR